MCRRWNDVSEYANTKTVAIERDQFDSIFFNLLFPVRPGIHSRRVRCLNKFGRTLTCILISQFYVSNLKPNCHHNHADMKYLMHCF